MADKITITITIDTELLLKKYPNGGEINNPNIISMKQDGGQFDFENGRKDKLISKVAPKTHISWEIESKSGNDQLELIKYLGDSNETKVYKNKPAKDKPNKFVADIKDDSPSENYLSNYNFEFKLSSIQDKTWNWDPIIQYPYPPV